MNFSHQPGFGFVSVLCAWLEADRPVCNRIALLFSAFNRPQVSYAMSNSGSIPPQSSRIGCFEWKFKVFPDVYEGSGPESERRESEADRDSTASRQGKDNAGFVDSKTSDSSSSAGTAAADWALRLAWW
jgi:hypothetical protein